MNLRQRTLLCVVATLACLIGGMYLVSSQVLMQNSETLERKETSGNLERFSDELAYQLGQMHANASDWSNWDDTYKFIADRNQGYIKSNLKNVLLDLDVMVFLDKNGKLVNETRLPRTGHAAPPYAEELRTGLGFDKPEGPRIHGDFSGIVSLKSGLVMVSVRPIVKTTGQGPFRGWTVFALRLDDFELRRLSQRTHLQFALYDLDHQTVPAECALAQQKLMVGSREFIKPVNERTIAGYQLLNDGFGKPARLLQVKAWRAIYAEASTSLKYLLVFTTIGGLLFGIVMIAVLEITALSRVSNLTHQVQRLNSPTADDEDWHIYLAGKDELSWLAKTIDGLVQGLKDRKHELRRKNENLESAFTKLVATNHTLTHTVEGVAEVNDKHRITDHNSSFAQLHGYVGQAIIGLHWQTLIAPQDHEKVAEAITEMIEVGKSRCEVCGLRRDGSLFWEEILMVVTNDGNDQVGSCHWFTKDISERKELEAKIKYQAYHDVLTGLPNRAMFVDCLRSACQKARRRGEGIGVLFIDLDQFKAVNDSMGHEAGDQLLALVAERIQSCVRADDVVARLGGDEFTVLLTELTALEEAVDIADRIIKSLETPIQLLAGKAFAGASIGIAFSRNSANEGYDADTLLHDADTAMYQAKEKSKPCFAVFEPGMNAPAAERKELAECLRIALENGELDLHYQPMVDLSSGKAIEVEAFLRWHDPIRGDVPPGMIVLAAEDTGLMDAIGDWSIRAACRQVKEWRGILSSDDLTVSVNLSGRQLLHPELAATIASILEETQVPPHCLRIEVSSRSLASDSDRSIDRMRQLKSIGIKLALDDFGTGSHLISKLGDYPFDMVKIDGTVTWLMETDEESRALANAMLIMAKSVNVQVVAEGIETLAQLQALREMGCPVGQGLIFAKPSPGDQVIARLAETIAIPKLDKKVDPDVAA